MVGRSDLCRAAAIIALIACFFAALAPINRRPSAPAIESLSTTTAPGSDDLSAELRRCSALGPQDAEDARCVAVWEENRQRFFGRPARPLPPRSALGVAAPAASSAGNAR